MAVHTPPDLLIANGAVHVSRHEINPLGRFGLNPKKLVDNIAVEVDLVPAPPCCWYSGHEDAIVGRGCSGLPLLHSCFDGCSG